VLGERRSPSIVFEHPGQDTIPTSIFVCETGGMVVICAGTTGYNADADLRYLWMRQKRLQGSHFANDEQSYAFNDLVVAGRIDPCLGDLFSFENLWEPHQLMFENRHSEGNMAALVGVTERGQTDLDDTLPVPPGWNETSTGEPMPDVVRLIRQDRESH
jgi:crotonyl-CoA carboxylase/reductase